MKIDFAVDEIQTLIFSPGENGDWEISISLKNGKFLAFPSDKLDCKGKDLIFTMVEFQMELARQTLDLRRKKIRENN